MLPRASGRSHVSQGELPSNEHDEGIRSTRHFANHRRGVRGVGVRAGDLSGSPAERRSSAELLAELTANRRRILFFENTIVAIRKLVPIRLPMDWSTPGERRTPADWVPDADVLTRWSEAITALTADPTAALPGDVDD